ncbi:hypothetical protein ACGFX2_36895 [Streptomyces goshikiensis]
MIIAAPAAGLPDVRDGGPGELIAAEASGVVGRRACRGRASSVIRRTS